MRGQVTLQIRPEKRCRSFLAFGRRTSEIVMPASEMVDAALAGLDQGEFVTIPSLPDAADWHAYEAARQNLVPNLSHRISATRYRASAAA